MLPLFLPFAKRRNLIQFYNILYPDLCSILRNDLLFIGINLFQAAALLNISSALLFFIGHKISKEDFRPFLYPLLQKMKPLI